jgi:hypothetical protein
MARCGLRAIRRSAIPRAAPDRRGYYAKIFDDVDPANRLPAEQAIRGAREPGISGVARLFDIAGGTS